MNNDPPERDQLWIQFSMALCTEQEMVNVPGEVRNRVTDRLRDLVTEAQCRGVLNDEAPRLVRPKVPLGARWGVRAGMNTGMNKSTAWFLFNLLGVVISIFLVVSALITAPPHQLWLAELLIGLFTYTWIRHR